MATKTKAPMPKCEAQGCTQDAAYGFRELVDTTSMASQASEFAVVSRMNVCNGHFDIGQHLYAGKKNVKCVDLSKA
jgi:hypothetical protein